MKKQVRIGGAAGALIDSTLGAPQLIAHGKVDYLILDYMAELATQMFAKAKDRDPTAGYSTEFTEWIWKDNVKAIAERGVKVITSAGGLNLAGCAERMRQLAAESGVELRIALVEGDDLLGQIDAAEWGQLTDMFLGAPLPKHSEVASANAYLGARAVADALGRGADVVLTGRVADSALALGPLLHEFGWADTDYDRLAAGSLAGHIIECGPQATGGLFTDWEQVTDWAQIGYPIVECYPDGTFLVTKPPGTGGLCSVGTVSEQMLYEIGDPAAYVLPDVVCDLREVQLTPVGPDQVRVTGVRGRPATTSYKVCGTYTDGLRAVCVLPVLGLKAVEKAERQAAALFERADAMLEARGLGKLRLSYFEVLGAETSYGAHGRRRDTREVILKIVAEHTSRLALEIFHREMRTPIIAMAPGNTGWFPGQVPIAPVVRLFSFLWPKRRVTVTVSLDGQRSSTHVTVPALDPDLSSPPRSSEAPLTEPALVDVPLIDLAWARSGDKGDDVNIAVIARDPSYLPYLRQALTTERLAEYFAHDFSRTSTPRVECYEVPGIRALNFVLHEVLGGGGMASTRLDAMGKGKAQQLLEITVPVPQRLADDARRRRAAHG
jgi:hypothetical protein